MRAAVTLLLAACLGACGNTVDLIEPPDTNDLIGTWRLASLDGVAAPSGTLTWILTARVLTRITPGCLDTGSWGSAGSFITVITIQVDTSEDCTAAVGDTLTFTYTISGTTMTAVVTPTGGAASTHVFERSGG